MKKLILLTATTAMLAACSTSGHGKHNGAINGANGTYSGVQNGTDQALNYDSFADRYYSIDPATGNTYWQNGSLRTTRSY